MATIVIQQNNLGIPGLVTSADHIYKVSCDYSSVTGVKKEANVTLTAKYASMLYFMSLFYALDCKIVNFRGRSSK